MTGGYPSLHGFEVTPPPFYKGCVVVPWVVDAPLDDMRNGLVRSELA